MSNDYEGIPFAAYASFNSDGQNDEPLAIYQHGQTDEHTLKENEYVEIHSVDVVTEDAQEVRVFTGDTATDRGTVVRGEFAANGGMVKSPVSPPHVGLAGERIRVAVSGTESGQVDVIVRGTIRLSGTERGRQSWRADLN